MTTGRRARHCTSQPGWIRRTDRLQLRREGKADEARTLLEAAIAAEPDRIDLNAPLVATYLALENLAAAEGVLRDRIKRHPTSGAHLALSRLRAERGKLDAALARQVIAVDEFPQVGLD